jgi:hypothetical protein
MFILRSRYDTLAKECSGHLDEIEVLREEYARLKKQDEKKTKSIDILYADAKKHAAKLSEVSEELIEARKDGQRLTQLKADIKELNRDLTDYMHPAPTDPEQRTLYVSRIAGHFNGGLTDYLNYMVSSFKGEISRFPLTERETDFHRAGINLCFMLLEWGEAMNMEHVADARGDGATQDAFEHTEEEVEAVENIKSAVNK